ncbi:hypothetical protein E2542_SST22690 [Spatholobus suberectus]|nr:hypothetical protein E2542_SST22690 [Spatholobus suberectus]
MANKYVALLLVVCLIVGEGGEAVDLDRLRQDCYNSCFDGCTLPKSFCKWWCNDRCQNAVLMRYAQESQ